MDVEKSSRPQRPYHQSCPRCGATLEQVDRTKLLCSNPECTRVVVSKAELRREGRQMHLFGGSSPWL
jgi:transcription initiation factor IIE alpha subunit